MPDLTGQQVECFKPHVPCWPIEGGAMDLRDAVATWLAFARGEVSQSDVVRGGTEYRAFWRCCEVIGAAIRCGRFSETEHRRMFESAGVAGTTESLIGHIFHRPHGYAGDFEIIDKIYRNHRSDHPAIRWMDSFVQEVPSSDAVRNRAAYLAGVIRELATATDATAHRPLRVLNIGCGPGRDVSHVFIHHPDIPVFLTCVDNDRRAIEHARAVLQPWEHRVSFIEANALKLRLAQTYDLVWSAGLFDYLSDRLFSALLRRMWRLTAPDGLVVVGNFAKVMDAPGPLDTVRWTLRYRDEAELMALALIAGVPRPQIRVDFEPTGLNLFLRARKSVEGQTGY